MKCVDILLKPKSSNQGVSLVELLLVISMVGFLILIVGSIPNSLGLIGQSRHISTAREIALAEIERLREIQYINLSTGQTYINDNRLRILPSGVGTSLIEICPISVCTNNEEAKQVTVTVTWLENNDQKKVQVTTVVSNGGL